MKIYKKENRVIYVIINNITYDLTRMSINDDTSFLAGYNDTLEDNDTLSLELNFFENQINQTIDNLQNNIIDYFKAKGFINKSQTNSSLLFEKITPKKLIEIITDNNFNYVNTIQIQTISTWIAKQ